MILETIALLALGDSLVNPSLNPVETSWPELIGAANIGSPGATAPKWNRPPLVDLIVPAEIALVLIGTNDALNLQSTPERYRGDLERLIEEMLDRGVVEVVLLKMPLFDGIPPSDTLRLEAYHLVIEDLCTGPVTCGPDLNEVMLPEHYGADLIHPLQSGHDAIAVAVEEFLAPKPAPSLTPLGIGAVLSLLGGMSQIRLIF